jgi:hypothetical protein
MNLPFQPTFNSIIMILIGLGLMAFGAWLALHSWSRMFGIGFLATGIGNVLFGATNGFTDMTPVGRNLFRFALVAYIVGVPLIAYYLYGELAIY